MSVSQGEDREREGNRDNRGGGGGRNGYNMQGRGGNGRQGRDSYGMQATLEQQCVIQRRDNVWIGERKRDVDVESNADFCMEMGTKTRIVEEKGIQTQGV